MAMQENLKRFRTEAKLTQAQLAEKAGVPQSQISEIESGKRLWTRFVPELATALEKRPQDLDERYGKETPDEAASKAFYRPTPRLMNYENTLPVYASAEGGQGTLIISTDEIARLPRPHTLETIDDAYAILVTGESMIEAYEPGDHAWVNPRLSPMRETDCILYSVDEATGEARATIKRVVSWTDKEWTLRQHNPKKQFKVPRTIWNKVHRVIGNFKRQ